MSYNSSDDGSEHFGGSPNLKYYIAVGADDDSLDVDTGAQMNVQYALLIQRSGPGDALFEIDSNGFETDTPRTKLQVSNFVAIQSAVSSSNEAERPGLQPVPRQLGHHAGQRRVSSRRTTSASA